MKNIPATKTNLLKVKKILSLTEEGYKLLDEKRKMLMLELVSIIDVIDKIREDSYNALREGYELVEKASVLMGKKKLEELSLSVNIKNEINISERGVMGVIVPVINFNSIDNPPYYSLSGVSLYVDEIIIKFKEVLRLFSQLAEKRITLLRISKELQKTIRKVNALEKIHIPFYRETLKYISDRLEEEARESFTMLKMIKKRREARESEGVK